LSRFLRTRLRALIAAVQFATLEIKLGLLAKALEQRYRADQPRAPKGTPEGGQWVHDRVRVAANGPRCDGFYGGCQSGGTFGTTGAVRIGGKNLCMDCAIKLLGIQGLSHDETMETLGGFDPIWLKRNYGVFKSGWR
jgi:hypothetical protein